MLLVVEHCISNSLRWLKIQIKCYFILIWTLTVLLVLQGCHKLSLKKKQASYCWSSSLDAPAKKVCFTLISLCGSEIVISKQKEMPASGCRWGISVEYVKRTFIKSSCAITLRGVTVGQASIKHDKDNETNQSFWRHKNPKLKKLDIFIHLNSVSNTTLKNWLSDSKNPILFHICLFFSSLDLWLRRRRTTKCSAMIPAFRGLLSHRGYDKAMGSPGSSNQTDLVEIRPERKGSLWGHGAKVLKRGRTLWGPWGKAREKLL